MINESTKDTHKYNTRSKMNNNKKLYKESSDNSSSSSEDESDEDFSPGQEVKDNISKGDYHEFLSNIFPSKFSNKKARISRNFENKYGKIYLDQDNVDSKSKNLDNLIIFSINPKRNNKNCLDESESESESESECESESESESEYESESESESESENRYKNKNIILKESKEDIEILKKFQDLAKKLQKNNKSNKLLKTIIKENNIKKKIINKKSSENEQNEKKKNYKQFVKLLNNKESIADEKFFLKSLNCEEQKKILNSLTLIKSDYTFEKPYLLSLLEKNIPNKFKGIALAKINTIKQMSIDKSSSEYNKLKYWVDSFMKIPFGNYKTLPISIEDGIEKSNEFILSAKNQLDNCVFGLEDAKLQILQLLGQWLVNPSSIGTAIAIHGPMGTGKTSLVRDGISKILNRPFAFIPLGGATDASTLEGHGYTYEGSTYGKIVDILIQSKTMNPIIMFDELDKVSDTPKGEEIIGILTHLTDPAQNSEFHDKYFSEIDFDLSKCLFIFSYNDDSKINPILKDRLYKIQTKGYDKKDKIIIANKYLLPKIQETVKLTGEQVIISDDTLESIINKYTAEEKGVRNLKRCLEIIYTKINLLRLIKPESGSISSQLDIKLEFPMNISVKLLDKFLTKLEVPNPPFGMYN